MISLRKVLGCASGAVFAFAVVSTAEAAAPGTINFVEGHVTLDNQVVATESAASVIPGHLLETAQGKAEVLLTPGAYLRLAEDSSIKVDALTDKDVRVEVLRGEALIEVDRLDQARQLDIIDKGADARVGQSGLYLFNASQPAVRVYDGMLRVEDDRRAFAMRRGEELLLGSSDLKPRKFDRGETDGIYAWSLQRAGYAAQVSEWTCEALLALNDGTRYDAGWYWSPWYKSWAFILPKGRIVSPLGYGYYAPSEPHYVSPVFTDFR